MQPSLANTIGMFKLRPEAIWNLSLDTIQHGCPQLTMKMNFLKKRE